MKKIFIFMCMMLAFTSVMAETVEPSKDALVEKTLKSLDINDVTYNDVVVNMQSVSPGFWGSTKYSVKITVLNNAGKKIWKKKLKNVFLYQFSDGQVKVANGDYQPLWIQVSPNGELTGTLKE